jgi:hypothetical integral membrane protein (TIGR02206 family)
VPLFGLAHISLLMGIAAAAVLLAVLCRRGRISGRRTRLILGYGLTVNELIWWAFRYSHEGVHLANLPLQLCDITLWATVLACFTLAPAMVEFAYFTGFAGGGMALLTPDLWSGWPSYPAIYFFVAHGAIIVACSVLVFGGIAPPRRGAVWRTFRLLAAYAAAVGAFNAIFGTNYMYLCRKPRNASLLDVLGPWPIYLVGGAAAGLALFWLLWLPVRPSTRASAPRA